MNRQQAANLYIYYVWYWMIADWIFKILVKTVKQFSVLANHTEQWWITKRVKVTKRITSCWQSQRWRDHVICFFFFLPCPPLLMSAASACLEERLNSLRNAQLPCHLAALSSVSHGARKQAKRRTSDKHRRETSSVIKGATQSSDSNIYSRTPSNTVESIISAFFNSGHVLPSPFSLLGCNATTQEKASMYVVLGIKIVYTQ